MKVYLLESSKGETIVVFSTKEKALKYAKRQNTLYDVDYKVVERMVF